jgi:hypothetical protein
MPIDLAWLSDVRNISDLANRHMLAIDGIEIELPISSGRGTARFRDWQRRVLPDIVPDSVNADAPERTPFRLLFALTTSQGTEASMDEVLSGELHPLEDLFRARTLTKTMTLAFHVLAVKAAGKGESDAKGFTERTILLLCRKDDGTLDVELVRDLVDQFRRPPSELDLAQRTVLERIQPGWSPSSEPTFDLPDSAKLPEIPFDREASRLFREDLRTLIQAALPPADFFQQLNLLLILHLGLYQPRVASLLSPQMEHLYREMERPDPRNLRDLEEMLKGHERRHPFTGLLHCRAPDPELRTVTLRTPARVSFEELGTTLVVFHFHLLVLVQLRRLGEAYLAQKWGYAEAWRNGRLAPEVLAEIHAATRGPQQFLIRMSQDPDFAQFLHKALTALAVRFVHNQIAEPSRKRAFEEIEKSASGLHALRHLYEMYNIQSSRNPTGSRAYRQGIQMTSSLLQQGQYGLVQGRQRVGPYFELGAGVLPLVLLLAVGAGREKVPVGNLWARLERYGLRFDAEERERLLSHLRSMGVYERYSDAGEAAYVRNLMTARAA